MFNPLFSDGFSHTDRYNKNGIVHYIFKGSQIYIIKNAPSCGSHVFHRLILGKLKKNLDIMFVASSSEPLPSVFKLCPWGPKMAPWQRSRVLLRLILKKS